jgi:hypothetical protein
MKILLVFTALILTSITCFGQKTKWQKVDQSYYGMKYELPDNWAIDGFGTSSVCHCAGTINSGKVKKNEIFMAAYPALSDSAIHDGMRTQVWDWEFVDTNVRTTHRTKSLIFEKTVSKWTTFRTDQFRFEDSEVWRFTTSFKNQYYVLYFWADPKVLPKNEKLILEILNRFKAVKVGKDAKYW